MFNLNTPLTYFENAEMKFESFQASRTLSAGNFVAQAGTELRGMLAVMTFYVQADAAKSAGLTVAQQKALLARVQADMRYGTGKDGSYFFQDRHLTELRLLQLKAFETEVEGFGANLGKGLSTPLVEGANELYAIIALPFGHIESIDENAIFGIGPEQVSSMAVKFTAKGDPLNALDGDLEVKGMFIRFAPDFRLAPEGDSGRRLSKWGVIPVLREIKENTQNAVATDDCLLPIEVVDVAKPTATTDFGPIEVTVGDVEVTNGDATPKDVEAHYERQPDTNDQEKLVASEVTTLYRRWDMPLNRMPTGNIKVKQTDGSEDFDVRAYYFPLKTQSEQWTEMQLHVAALARRVGNASLEAHFISPIAVSANEGLKVEDRFLGTLGWYACLPGDTEYVTVPGLRLKAGEKVPRVVLPKQLFAGKFAQWVAALADRDRDTMTMVVQSIARCLPTAILGPSGFASGKARVVEVLEGMFRNALESASPDLVTVLDNLA